MRYVKNDTSLRKMYGLAGENIQLISAFFDELEVYDEKYLDIFPKEFIGEWMLALSFKTGSTYDRNASFSKLVNKKTGIAGDTVFFHSSGGKWEITRSGIVQLNSESIYSCLRYYGKHMMLNAFLFTIERTHLEKLWEIYMKDQYDIKTIVNYICSVSGRTIHIVHGYDGLSINVLFRTPNM